MHGPARMQLLLQLPSCQTKRDIEFIYASFPPCVQKNIKVRDTFMIFPIFFVSQTTVASRFMLRVICKDKRQSYTQTGCFLFDGVSVEKWKEDKNVVWSFAVNNFQSHSYFILFFSEFFSKINSEASNSIKITEKVNENYRLWYLRTYTIQYYTKCITFLQFVQKN